MERPARDLDKNLFESKIRIPFFYIVEEFPQMRDNNFTVNPIIKWARGIREKNLQN